ncbi:hypothetical protein BGW41_006619 [Actinomortierella wolfii]|nr:hypothetical protein BGW41_006619 [Actinomortierella wolfii]
MFKFLWTRASSTSAEANASSSTSTSATTTNASSIHADDWVLLPSDYDDMMSQSISNLDLVSASTMLPRSSSSSSNAHDQASISTSSAATDTASQLPTKSRRQLKYELRKRQAQEEAERTPRYDPHMARLRDVEFKMAKMSRLGLRSGRIMSSSNAKSAGGGRSALTGAFAQQKVC